MTTNTRIFRSTDVGAPVITGQLGTFKDAIKKMAVGDGTGVAYGTGGNTKLCCGWSNAFPAGETTTKIAIQNSAAAGGSGCIARVLDDGSGTASFREAFLRVYKTMSDIDTGAEPTPSAAQFSVGAIARKSSTLDSVARPWIAVGDELTFYMCIDQSNSTGLNKRRGACVFGFGDFASYVPSDGYPIFCAGNNQQNSDLQNEGWLSVGGGNSGVAWTAGSYTGLAVMRDGIATAGAISAFLGGVFGGTSGVSGGWGNANGTFMANPPAGSNENQFTPAFLIGGGILRGRLRGMYLPLNAMSTVAIGTNVSGANGVDAGSVLTMFMGGTQQSSSSEASVAYPYFETVLPW